MRAVFAGFALLVVTATAASAHGVYTNSSPPKGERLGAVPDEVRVTLTEDPAHGSTIRVTDGCGRNVVEHVNLEGPDLVAVVGGHVAPEPGAWRVSFRSISAVDGHPARGSFAFEVRGNRDCARDEGPVDEKTESPDTSSQPPIVNDETSFPWMPFALGTLVLVVVALIARRARS